MLGAMGAKINMLSAELLLGGGALVAAVPPVAQATRPEGLSSCS